MFSLSTFSFPKVYMFIFVCDFLMISVCFFFPLILLSVIRFSYFQIKYSIPIFLFLYYKYIIISFLVFHSHSSLLTQNIVYRFFCFSKAFYFCPSSSSLLSRSQTPFTLHTRLSSLQSLACLPPRVAPHCLRLFFVSLDLTRFT